MNGNTVGIITEYNPFHNGHAYHIQKAKEITGASNVVVIMSGNFLQRGEPAIIDKYSRTEMALKGGADLVIELPVLFANSSAQYFAYGAVSLLTKMNCIDFLVFGSETDDISLLENVADVLFKEPQNYKDFVKKYTSSGFSFPKAREMAIIDYFNLGKDSTIDRNDLENIFNGSNNILGLEYIKAIKYFKSSIKPICLKRNDSGYLSKDLTSEFSSASAIRHNILNEDGNFAHAVPEYVNAVLKNNFNKISPVEYNDFSTILKYKLLSEEGCFEEYVDVNNDLANAISNNIYNWSNFENLSNKLKNKSYTQTRINRCLFHILLNTKNTDLEYAIDNDYGQYLRILGFNKKSNILKDIKVNSSIPLLSKLADSKNILTNEVYNLLLKDIYAADVYNAVVYDKFQTVLPNEYTRNLVIHNI